MQRILIFCRSKGWGGTEKHTLSLAKGLQSKGYRVRLIINSKLMVTKCKEENLEDIQFKKSGGDFNPLSFVSTYQSIKSFQPDIIFLSMSKDYWLGGFASYLYKKAACVLWLGIERQTKQSFKYKQIYGRFTDLVIVNSELIKTRLLESTPQLDQQQVRVIYNGIEIKTVIANQTEWKRSLNIDAGSILIGAAGRLTEQKGFDFLPEICHHLVEAKLDFKLLIAGTGPDLDLIKKLAKKHQVEDKILFLGFVEDMNHFFANIDLFVLPSRHEGMAFVLNEAMSFGKPIVANQVSGVDELLLNGELGSIVEIGDTIAFSNAIQVEIKSADGEHSNRMKKHIIEHYSFDAMVNNYEKVFLEL